VARGHISRGGGRRGAPLPGRFANEFIPRCACGQISYPTEVEARIAIANQSQGSPDKKPSPCGDVWHTPTGSFRRGR
jgi:hypothetical protein